ncbi:acetyltransferase [Haoranjiania flava]|uniref:Acetyltransferase n=1 Tax=Haoranjiania flava TaxID=1856322 RepID=A0AAE3IRU6_9BACT|nr:acetyltransferase [Haoranjiania flava]MCU7694607.1 acetyltransferase [Haoranjiania flava]
MIGETKLIQNVVIYGDSAFAEQAYNQIDSDDRYNVVAFTVDESKYNLNTFNQLPVIKFQQLTKYYLPDDIIIFPAIGYSSSNKIREIVAQDIICQGYELMTYISNRAFIGRNAVIGRGSYICEFVSIGMKAKIGDCVIILANSSIAHDVVIENFSFLSHSVIVGGNAVIKHHAFVGLNATVKDHVTVAEYNTVGAGANVINNTFSNAIYVGNPAKIYKTLT